MFSVATSLLAKTTTKGLLTGAAFGAILLFGAVQTARIEGFLFVDGYKQQIADRDSKIVLMRRASDEAWVLMQQQIAQTEAHYAKLAKEADRDHLENLSAATDAAGRYVAANRVRQGDFCRSRPATTAEGPAPSVPVDLPAGAVVVSEGDVLACTGATSYAIDAHNAAVKQIEAGLAE